MQDGLKKVVNGLTSFEEILRVIDIETDFGDGDEELRAALLGKIPIPHNDEDEETTQETTQETTTETLDTQPEVLSMDAPAVNVAVAQPKAPAKPKVDPNNPDFEIPTEEKLSFNQGGFDFGEEMSYDDFDDDYGEEL